MNNTSIKEATTKRRNKKKRQIVKTSIMTKSDILAIVTENILEILPSLNREDIRLEKSMRDLGANSIDRADVVVKTMADLSLKIPLVEFARIKDIGGLVSVFYKNMQ